MKESSEAIPPWTKRIVGRSSTEWVVRRTDCPVFDPYDLVEMVHIEGGAFYRIVRERWPFTLVLICVGGGGTMRSSGQSWQIKPGQAFILPAQLPHDLEATDGGFSCTMLSYRSEAFASHQITHPRLVSIHAQSLEAMITAFRREYQSDRDPALLQQMLDIIQTKILRLFNPLQNASRLWPLWKAVLDHPEFNWSIGALSQRAHLSGEHLRRICLAETKRSPMAHVTWLRLKAAANRLAVGNDIIEEIAHQVGFESERAFRSAFTKCFACSPSEYRQNNRQAIEALNTSSTSTDTPRLSSGKSSTLSAVAGYAPTEGTSKPLFLKLHLVLNSYFSKGDRPWFGDFPLHLSTHGITQIHGVPFLIQNENKGSSFLLMRSKRIEKSGSNKKLPDKVKVSLGRRCRSIYFLHACGWGSEFGPFASYRINFKDHSVVEIPLIVLAGAHAEETDGSKANIQDWYYSWDQLTRPYAKPYDATPPSNPLASSQYLYTLEWKNPHPSKVVSFLEICSDPNCAATLGVLAVTCF